MIKVVWGVDELPGLVCGDFAEAQVSYSFCKFCDLQGEVV